MYKNASVAVAGLIYFGRAAQPLFLHLEDKIQDKAVTAAAQAISEEYGCKLAGLVLHLDEAAPHAHFTLEPRCAETGASFAKLVDYRKMQDLVADAMQPFEPRITRGTRKARGATGNVVHRSVQELHDELPALLASAREELSNTRQQTQQERRRLETLSRQNQEMQEQLRQARKQLEDAQESVRQMTETWRARYQAVESREQQLQARVNAFHEALTHLGTWVDELVASGITPPPLPDLSGIR